MPAVKAAPASGVRQPYPGLRPFEPDDAIKFYGREPHTAELLRRLAENRFVAVIGNSGSGKSSLVKAGLLPALYRGRLIGATSQWRICIMRPGDAPMRSMADSMAESSVPSRNTDAVLQAVSRSSQGLVRAVRDSQFAPGESLLLVVDQFEELFRFGSERRQQDGGAEARLFVASLLEATEMSSAPIYAVLTMRSDFLGDCSRFPGLPEALNRSQYLIPRMTREQVREAIEKPLRLVDAHMSDKLVERLLNELGDDTGQLPVLQHALNRTFHEFSARAGAGEIGVDDYKAAKGMQGALNAHAEAVLDSLRAQGDLDADRWTEKVFRCLTTMEGGRKIRRPTRMDKLLQIVSAADEDAQKQVRRVVSAYSDPDNAMLFWSGRHLTGDSVVDIAHESLIEHWEKLRGWVELEADAARLYKSAALDAARQGRHAAAKWRGTKLSEALAFLDKGPWSQAWAARFRGSDASFEEVNNFVTGEAATQEAEEREKVRLRARELAVERQAKEAAEARAVAEMRLRQQVERSQAELRAREAAEAAAAAERRKKRLAAAFLIAGVVTLGLAIAIGVLVQYSRNITSRNRELVLKSQIAEAQKGQGGTAALIPALRTLVNTSDDLLKELSAQERDLSNQIGQEPDQTKKAGLQERLGTLQTRQSQVQALRDLAHDKLAALSMIPPIVNPVDGLKYIIITAGTFTMGCSPGDHACDDDETPPHAVQIPKGFWLGQTEVTQAAWEKVMGDNPSTFKGDQLPVENVDWKQAEAYCKAIGGRLPTEREWEYAARGGTTGARYGPLDDVAWYEINSNSTHPVRLKQANPFGLYDMLGNVWEWTADSYDAAHVVVRGGSWANAPDSIRASVRRSGVPADRDSNIGFRCAGDFH